MQMQSKGTDEMSEAELQLFERTQDDLAIFKDEHIQGVIFRSKVQWHNDGQSASKYLFSLEKSKSASKSMKKLITDSGEEITDMKQILYKQRKFYEKMYKSQETDKFEYINEEKRFVLPEIRTAMEGKITIDEIKLALKGMARNKTPGLDGLTPELYIVFFKQIGNLMLEAINHAFTTTGTLHESALRGVINLIPKRNSDVRKLDQLRPITILNTDYKVVEKVLANRLKPALDYIIKDDQKGFMANRRISCNIRRVLDIIEYAEQNDMSTMIVSIDFMKCFDRIEIGALKNALSYFNIGPEFSRWIDVIYNKPRACVVNNGFFSSYFDVSRGVKQGGPCSAYLFLLIAEVLANELRKNNKIHGFILQEIEKILGQYADDIDLYLNGDDNSLNEALVTIQKFCKISGFRINYNKTTVYRVGSLRRAKAICYTAEKLNWTEGNINVLGVELTFESQKLNRINYEPIIKKAQVITKMWKNRGLSLIGKTLIVNVLIASLFVYKMSVLPSIEESFIKDFETVITNFLWDGKKPKISLNDLKMPKSQGGVGLVDIRLKDKSLKAAWVKMLCDDELLSKTAYQKLNNVIKHEIWLCNISKKDIELVFGQGFWKNVLESWSELNYKEPKLQTK